MRTDYGKVDLGTGVRAKYLKDYYALGGVTPLDAKPAKDKKAPPPRGRKRR